MKTLKTIAAGLTATMLATTILTAAGNAAPKPKINLGVKVAPNVVKNNIVKSIRPRIAPRIRVNTANLAPKHEQEPDNTIGKDAGPRSNGNNPVPTAALIPPTRLPQPRPDHETPAGSDAFDKFDRSFNDLQASPAVATPPLPQPRPEFFDRIVDLKDIIGAEGLGEINPDEFRVGTNRHDPDGLLAGLGLPGYEDEDETAGNVGPTGPAGGVPDGFGDNGDGLGNGPEFDGLVGDNSHGGKTPASPGGLSVKGFSVSDVDAASEKPPKVEDTGWRTFSDQDGEYQDRSIVTTYADGSSVVENYTVGPFGSTQTVTVVDPDGVWDSASTDYFPDGRQSGEPVYDSGVITTELRDPDYVEGGGYVPLNCGSYECNKARQRQANPGLALKEAQDGATRVYPGPDGGNTNPGNNGEPVISQHDLVANYDPDSNQNGGGPVRNLPSRIQSD